MAIDAIKNFAKGDVSTGYSSSDVEIILNSGHGLKFPDPSTDGSFNVVWWNSTLYKNPGDDPSVEIVRCTTKSIDTLGIIRAQEGTSASNKNTTGSVYSIALTITKKTIDDIKNEISSISGVAGPATAVDSNFAAFDTTTGKLIKDSGKKASDFQTALGFTAVPNTRTVNTKALSANIVLTPDDLDDSTTSHKFVSAADVTSIATIGSKVSKDGASTTGNLMQFDSSGNAHDYGWNPGLLVPATRTVNTKNLGANIVITPDDLDDTSTSHKFVASTDITNWNAKQAALGFTPENVGNKVTTVSSPTDAQYFSAKLTNDQLALKAPLRPVATKVTLVDADETTGNDSAASFGQIKTTWTNVKAFLKTYFDTLYRSKSLTAYSDLNLPEGTMFNGKIVPSVTSGNLTVALKGMDGNDPSPTNPVYVRIGGVVRAITGALSVTKNAGTSYCNAGATELATKEIDYFVYLGYNATDGVTIGFSRYNGNLYSDFSTTNTNEKYCAISTITNATAGDNYINIGRFAATLSAGAGYTWSVPTFTANNLIQKPVYKSRALAFNGILYGSAGSAGTYADDNTQQYYMIDGNTITIYSSGRRITNVGSWSGDVRLSMPWTTLSPTQYTWGDSFGIWANNTLTKKAMLAYWWDLGGLNNYILFTAGISNSYFQWSSMAVGDIISGKIEVSI